MHHTNDKSSETIYPRYSSQTGPMLNCQSAIRNIGHSRTRKRSDITTPGVVAQTTSESITVLLHYTMRWIMRCYSCAVAPNIGHSSTDSQNWSSSTPVATVVCSTGTIDTVWGSFILLLLLFTSKFKQIVYFWIKIFYNQIKCIHSYSFLVIFCTKRAQRGKYTMRSNQFINYGQFHNWFHY